MDPLIERFERILRSFFNEKTSYDRWEESVDDSDYRDAWAELDDFLNSDSFSSESNGKKWDDFFEENKKTGAYRYRMPPEMLRNDYRLLNVSFGAPFEEVRSSYRNLMRRHHPDLHSSDPSQQEHATRRAQELNISYQRIKAWELAKNGV